MVPARPFFIGSDGWVRSRAWIWLFSSTHSTTALSGGFRYSPTTSVSFSRNRLSLETLKVRTRWGWSPAASQIRPTVAGLTPATFAMERVDQWVSPFGFVLVEADDLRDLLRRDGGLAPPSPLDLGQG